MPHVRSVVKMGGNKCFSLHQEVNISQTFQYYKLLGYLSCHIGNLLIEFQLVNSDTKEYEVFTKWYRIITMELWYRKLFYVWDFKCLLWQFLQSFDVKSFYFSVVSGIKGVLNKIQTLLLQIQGVVKEKIIFKEFSRT